MKISGVYTARDTFDANYPFVESILSVLPAVDEFLVNDGGSDDGTLETLYRLEDTYDKIEIYEIEDIDAKYWRCIDMQIEELMDEASGDWIFESQADEMWEPRDLKETVNAAHRAHEEGCNSIRQPRLEIDRGGSVVSQPCRIVRLVRNIDEISSSEGGDNFYIGNNSPKDGYTSHSATPELEIDTPFYHANCWYDTLEKARRHAEWLAPEHDVRQKAYEQKKEAYGQITNPNDYEIDERMFDPEWLSDVTGFDYTSM